MITGIIMASGFSKRMGKNKLLMEFRGKTLIEYVFEELKKVHFKEVVVVSQYNEVLEIGKKYGFTCVLNKNSHLGQSESIKLGIINSLDSDGYMFFVGDQPLIDEKYINTLIEAFYEDKEHIIIPRYKEKNGNPVIFPKEKKEELLSLRDDERGKKVIKNSNNVKFVQVSENMLLDVDTIDDFERIKKLI